MRRMSYIKPLASVATPDENIQAPGGGRRDRRGRSARSREGSGSFKRLHKFPRLWNQTNSRVLNNGLGTTEFRAGPQPRDRGNANMVTTDSTSYPGVNYPDPVAPVMRGTA